MNTPWDNSGYEQEQEDRAVMQRDFERDIYKRCDEEDMQANLHAAGEVDRKISSNTTDRLCRVAGLAIGFSIFLYLLYFYGR